MSKENYQSDNNEISLFEFFNTLWENKYFIAIFMVISSIIIVLYVINLENIYQSKAVLKPTQNNKVNSSLSKLQSITGLAGIDIGSSDAYNPYYTLKSIANDNNFLASFVKKNKFEEKLIPEYDQLSTDPIFEKNYNYYVSKNVRKSIHINEDSESNFIEISFQSTDRFFAKDFLEIFLIEISKKNKEISMKSLQQQINSYKKEISSTSDISIKTSLSTIVADLIQQKVLAQAQKYYNFTLIIEPSVPNELNKVKPRRSMISIALFIVSLILCISIVVFIDWSKNNRKKL